MCFHLTSPKNRVGWDFFVLARKNVSCWSVPKVGSAVEIFFYMYIFFAENYQWHKKKVNFGRVPKLIKKFKVGDKKNTRKHTYFFIWPRSILSAMWSAMLINIHKLMWTRWHNLPHFFKPNCRTRTKLSKSRILRASSSSKVHGQRWNFLDWINKVVPSLISMERIKGSKFNKFSKVDPSLSLESTPVSEVTTYHSNRTEIHSSENITIWGNSNIYSKLESVDKTGYLA